MSIHLFVHLLAQPSLTLMIACLNIQVGIIIFVSISMCHNAVMILCHVIILSLPMTYFLSVYSCIM